MRVVVGCPGDCAPGGARVSECPKSPRRALLRRPVETESDWRAHQRPPPLVPFLMLRCERSEPHQEAGTAEGRTGTKERQGGQSGEAACPRGRDATQTPARSNPGAATVERILMQGGCHSHNVSSPASPAKPGEGRGTSRHCQRKTRRAGVYWMPDQVGHDRLVFRARALATMEYVLRPVAPPLPLPLLSSSGLTRSSRRTTGSMT